MQNNIFGFEHGNDILIGVVADNRIKFYEIEYKGKDEIEWSTWNVVQNMELMLPNGYENVFYYYDGIIGVVANYRVQFYEYDGNYWNIIQNMDKILPVEYNDLFIFVDEFFDTVVGVVAGNIIRFYNFNGRYWFFESEVYFTPSNEFRGAFFLRREFDSFGQIGMIVDDKVVFHTFDGSRDSELILPDGSRGVFCFAHGVVAIILQDRVQFLNYRDNGWNVIQNTDFIK